VALAWLLAQKPWIVPIPGTRRLERLDENLDRRISTSHPRTWQNSTAHQPACRSRATATQKPCNG
jgi:aryl-alcohol dehydrogenase-like predicted oxidoreductase